MRSVSRPPAAPFRLAALALALLACAAGRPALAAPAVSVTMTGSGELTLDSNNACASGPGAAYVSFRITNTTGAALADLRATASGFANGIALGGGQSATQNAGTLAAGASKTLFWYVVYPCSTPGASATVTVAVSDNTAGATSGTGLLTTVSMISSQAGGTLVSSSVGAGAVAGQTIAVDQTYEFGGVASGDTYDLQPTGNASFNAACFQLAGAEVTASTVTAIPVGTRDRLYHTAAARQSGSGFQVTIRYLFQYRCSGASTTIRPYSNQFSGGGLKYASNYETVVGPSFPTSTNPFTVSGALSPSTLAAGGTATYTFTLSNPSAYASELGEITVELPAGLTFGAHTAASAVTVANSSTSPAGGASGTLRWRGIPGTSYVVPAGGSVALVFTVNVTSAAGQYGIVPNAYVGAPSLDGSGTASRVGPATSPTTRATVGTADVTVTATSPARVTTGQQYTYTLTASNAGPHTAYDEALRFVLPAGVTYGSSSDAGTFASGAVMWPAVTAMAPNASLTRTVVVTAPSAPAALTAVPSGTSSTFDPNASNNDGSGAGSGAATAVGYPVAFADGTGFTPTPATPGTSNNAVGRFRLTTGTAGANLTALALNVTGARSGVTAFKLFSSTDAVFNAATDVLLGSQPDAGTVTFGGLSTPLSTAGTYFFLATDLASGASGTALAVVAAPESVTLASGTLTSTFTNAALSNPEASLPVELAAFDVRADGAGAAVVRWTTASETNNAGFSIEVRANGAAAWAEVAFVNGHGTTAEANAYARRVDALAPGRYAFRLRQVDFDGSAAYSNEVEADVVSGTAASLTVLPHSVRFSARAGRPVTLALYDALGRRVAVLFEGTLGAGGASEAALPTLPAGAYFVRLVGAGAALTKSVIAR